MASIITYDVSQKHKELKKELLALGYQDRLPDPGCKLIHLPNTTFYHHSKTPVEARIDLQLFCLKLQTRLERCVATQWTNWAAICGEEFKS